MSDFWDGSDWDNADFTTDDEDFSADEDFEVDYEVEEEDVVYEEKNDATLKRRRLCKKAGFYSVGVLLLGVGNALIKRARKWKKRD